MSTVRFSSVLILIATLTSISANVQRSVKDFEGGPFTISPQPSLYSLSDLGFDDLKKGVRLLSVVDINNDKFNDLIAADDDNKNLTIYYWNHEAGSFKIHTSVIFDKEIKGVIPADINYDGYIDLVVTLASDKDNEVNVQVHLQGDDGITDKSSKSVNIPYQQPTVFDLNGDRRLDFLITSDDGTRTIIDFQNGTGYNTTDFSKVVSSSDGCISYDQVKNRKISQPNFNSFIDLNGDCRADLFIMSEDNDGNTYFEVWIRQAKTTTYCLVDNAKLTVPVASLGFANIRGSSAFDMVYIEQDKDTSMRMHIVYNQFLGSTSKPCEADSESFYKSPFGTDGSADLFNSHETSSAKSTYLLSEHTSLDAKSRLYADDTKDRPHQIRFGDINMDGHPDALITVYNSETKDAKSGSTYVLTNSPCTICPDENSRYLSFVKSKTDVNDIISKEASLYGLFFDYDEIGTQSLMLVSMHQNGYTTISGYFNNLNEDSFFLKALGRNGASEDENRLGGIYYGPSIECLVTEINGDRILMKSYQLSRGHYNALQLPYSFLGLGRTNNYIENFVFGIPTSGNNTHLWTPIIPNSQLIINPYGNTDTWTLDVFVKPTKKTLIVIVTTVVILFVLGLVICYLHYKEKEEDKQHQEKYLQILG